MQNSHDRDRNHGEANGTLRGLAVSGARVIIASRETASDGRLLLEALRALGATVMQATPATWRMLIDVGWNGQPALKVLCGGEAMTPRWQTS